MPHLGFVVVEMEELFRVGLDVGQQGSSDVADQEDSGVAEGSDGNVADLGAHHLEEEVDHETTLGVKVTDSPPDDLFVGELVLAAEEGVDVLDGRAAEGLFTRDVFLAVLLRESLLVGELLGIQGGEHHVASLAALHLVLSCRPDQLAGAQTGPRAEHAHGLSALHRRRHEVFFVHQVGLFPGGGAGQGVAHCFEVVQEVDLVQAQGGTELVTADQGPGQVGHLAPGVGLDGTGAGDDGDTGSGVLDHLGVGEEEIDGLFQGVEVFGRVDSFAEQGDSVARDLAEVESTVGAAQVSEEGGGVLAVWSGGSGGEETG